MEEEFIISETRFLDTKLTLLGMERDEFLVFLLPLTIFFLMNMFPIGLLVGLPLMFTVKRIKAGKPEGYLMHMLYRFGMPFPGLLPPHITHFEE